MYITTALCFQFIITVVIWTRLYKSSSSIGTLYQLRNLINRRNVVMDPKDDMNACEDFFELTVNAHILAAAMTILGMNSLSDDPSPQIFPQNLSTSCDQEVALQSIGE